MERLEKRDWASARRWLARVAVTNMLAASLMVPATHSLAESVPESHLDPQSHSQSQPELQSEPEPQAQAQAHIGPTVEINQPPPPPRQTGPTYRDTGIDTQPCFDFGVCGTDLGEAFRLPPDEDGKTSVGYWFGDTLKVAGPFLELPPGVDYYRPQVMLRSDMIPVAGQPIIFDSAAGVEGHGIAPELLNNSHSLPNDGVSLPNGDIIMSYQRIANDADTLGIWATDQAGLAISHDGGNHFELVGPTWENNSDNSDPYQMWSMQRDGEYVYIVSVRAGRQPGPMMLFRVHWDQMQNQDDYTYWNGTDWGEKNQATPIMQGHIGEPSLRKLDDGTWALAYTDYAGGAKVVTQTIVDPTKGPEGQWSKPKLQLHWRQLPALYGGFIHPDSTRDNLILIISSWQRRDDGSKHGILIRYDVSHLIGKL